MPVLEPVGDVRIRAQAGLAVGLENGESLENALRMGAAAAGAAVATEGTQAAPAEMYRQLYSTISIQKVM